MAIFTEQHTVGDNRYKISQFNVFMTVLRKNFASYD